MFFLLSSSQKYFFNLMVDHISMSSKPDSKDISLLYFFWKRNSEKILRIHQVKKFRKMFFNLNMLTHIAVDAVFGGDHENHSHIAI